MVARLFAGGGRAKSLPESSLSLVISAARLLFETAFALNVFEGTFSFASCFTEVMVSASVAKDSGLELKHRDTLDVGAVVSDDLEISLVD